MTSYTIDSCVPSGAFTGYNGCGNYPAGTTLPIQLSINQSDRTVTGTLRLNDAMFLIGTPLGEMQFGVAGQVADPSNVVALNGASEFHELWQVSVQTTLTQSAESIAGTLVQTWEIPGAPGQVLVNGTLLPTVRRVQAQSLIGRRISN